VVPRGERIAMMKPGTRVNLFLPSNVKVKVSAGEKVIGGTTVVAKFE
jgi:phosphatidylserine decarboxylase